MSNTKLSFSVYRVNPRTYTLAFLAKAATSSTGLATPQPAFKDDDSLLLTDHPCLVTRANSFEFLPFLLRSFIHVCCPVEISTVVRNSDHRNLLRGSRLCHRRLR